MTKQRISNVIAWAAFAYALIFIFLVIGVILEEVNGLMIGLENIPIIAIYEDELYWSFYPISLIINYVITGKFRVFPWRKT